LSISVYLAAPIALTSFISATYSLVIFTSTQHGTPPATIGPLTLYSHRTHLLILLHAVPLFLLIAKPSLTCLWL
jgi:hypothetical protein